MTPFPAIVVALDQNRWKLAAELIREALRDDSEHPWLMAHLAVCQLNMGDWLTADKTIRQTLSVDAEFAFAHYLMGVVIEEAIARVPLPARSFRIEWRQHIDPRHRNAERCLREAIRLEPEDPRYFGSLASNLLKQNRHAAAQDVVEQGLSHEPENIDLLNLLAQILNARKQVTPAEAVTLTALAHRPDDAYSQANRGWLMLHQHRIDEAFVHFRESLRLYPESIWARVGMQEALKQRFKPYRWIAKTLHWLAQYDSKGEVKDAWLVGAALLFAVVFVLLATIGLLASDRPFDVFTWLAVSLGGGFLAGLLGLLCGILVVVGARAMQGLANIVLLFSRDGRHTITESQRFKLWLVVTLSIHLASFFTLRAAQDAPIRWGAAYVVVGLVLAVGLAGLLAIGYSDIRRRFWAAWLICIAVALASTLLTDPFLNTMERSGCCGWPSQHH